MKILVECTLQVEVEVSDDLRDIIEFQIEENGCPGTGVVGSKIDSVMEDAEEKRVCWACNLKGANKILSIDGVPFERLR